MIQFSKVWSCVVIVLVVILTVNLTILSAQTNDAPISEETNPPNDTNKGDTAAKIELQQEDSTSPSATRDVDPVTKVELKNFFNELRKEYLDTREAFVDRWMWLITILLALFGLVIPLALAIVSYIMGRNRFRELEVEARKYVEEIKGYRAQAEAYNAGFTSEDMDDPDRAAEVEEAIRDVQSDFEPSLISKVVDEIYTLQRDDRIAEAIEKWRSIANIAEGNDNELAARAWLSIRYLSDEEEERRDAYDKAMDLDPSYTRAYMSRRDAKYSNLSRHGIVVGAVQHYFDDPKFGKFSTALECRIGSGSYRADVVVYDEGRQLTVAVECMRIGYIDKKIKDRLKEYFRHSDAQFGILAADTDPSKWTFLRMLGNEINEVNRSQFEEGLVGSGSA